MKENSKYDIENFLLSALAGIIEGNSYVDKFDNLVFNGDKKEIKDEYNNLIEKFVKELDEDREEIKQYLMKLCTALGNKNTKPELLRRKEYQLVSEFLKDDNMDLKKCKLNKENSGEER